MGEIILKTDKPAKATEILKETLKTEAMRIQYSLQLTRKRLSKFEDKYKVTSDTFIKQWAAEDLEGGDLEYVEWAGEYRFSQNLSERLAALNSIKHVAA